LNSYFFHFPGLFRLFIKLICGFRLYLFFTWKNSTNHQNNDRETYSKYWECSETILSQYFHRDCNFPFWSFLCLQQSTFQLDFTNFLNHHYLRVHCLQIFVRWFELAPNHIFWLSFPDRWLVYCLASNLDEWPRQNADTWFWISKNVPTSDLIENALYVVDLQVSFFHLEQFSQVGITVLSNNVDFIKIFNSLVMRNKHFDQRYNVGVLAVLE
jgi:hypothetical protein